MRVVAGELGGRRLNVLEGRDIRPTSDKVRGAVFNALIGLIEIESVFVLDLFCGTGALGIEALSRGALHCVFVDQARSSLNLARQNVATLGVEEQSDFILSDAKKVHFSDVQRFDLVFLDPPYNKDLILPCLDCLGASDALNDGAVCVLESEAMFQYKGCQHFEMIKSKVYGDTLITYLRYRKSVA
ncbi:MAG: 16S rRNA (guanine(966)-N(2))-methyltransferase RsmD [Bdellovibrionales bacterium]